MFACVCAFLGGAQPNKFLWIDMIKEMILNEKVCVCLCVCMLYPHPASDFCPMLQIYGVFVTPHSL